MKKIMMMVMILVLLLSLASGVMAEGKTVYLEVKDTENEASVGPTLGFDWGVAENWTISLSYQFEGEEENDYDMFSIGAEYGVNDNLVLSLSYEISDPENGIIVEISSNYALSEVFSLNRWS